MLPCHRWKSYLDVQSTNALGKFTFDLSMVLSMTSHQQALAALLDEHSSLTGLRVRNLKIYIS